MTVFLAAQKAILRSTGEVIDGLFSEPSLISREMADLANEVARDIAEGHEWRALLKTVTVPSGTSDIALPDDFDRMSSLSGVGAFLDAGEWASDYGRGWVILDGRIRFRPQLSGNETLVYVSSNYALKDGVEAPEFSADNDQFRLPDSLLTLGLIWRWKAQKGLEYAEDMANYNIALSRAQVRDRGPFSIGYPRTIRGYDVGLSYSGRAIR